MTITVRKAEKKDAQKLSELLKIIARLHHEGRPDIYGADGAKYNLSDVEKKIENTDDLILVAVNEDDIVMGYTMSKIFDIEENGILLGYRKMYIDDVCVDPSARQLGIGRKLMETTKKEAEKSNCHIVELNVWAFNESAVEFYKSCGMTVQRMYMEYVLD